MLPLDDLGSRSARLGLITALVLGLGAVMLLPSSVGVAAATARPSNTAEPEISGRAEQGRTLSASRGRWTGTGTISYAYRWVRCGPAGGRPDASNCGMISGATRSRYELVNADVGYRLRVRVTATNAEGAETVASNPTQTVVGPPVNTSIPLVSGTALVGSVVTVHPGSWSGRRPIGFSHAWLRCNTAGGECVGIGGATGRSYRATSSDVNHKLRVNVTARNAIASVTVLSSESAVVSVPLPTGAIRLPSGEISIPATSVPSDQRLIVSRVAFSPNPVTSTRQALTVRVRVSDSRSYVVRDAVVFVRSTPRVTTGGRLLTATDGWLTFRLQPLATFPLKKQGNVQFFVKAYRAGDPPLAGVAAYRLVQVRLAR